MIEGQAQAKINLFLHIIGKRHDNYHNLESMAVFAEDLYDQITIYPATDLTLTITGPFAAILLQEEVSSNSIIKAALALRARSNNQLGARIELIKNIPVAAGIGGGTADAALALKLLCQLWQIDIPSETMLDIALKIGADVPICYHNQPAYFSGIGEIISPIENIPSFYAVLINPGQKISTPQIFKKVTAPYHQKLGYQPTNYRTMPELIDFLQLQSNDLQVICASELPIISEIIASIAAVPHCLLSRMSGSGPTCFGLFEDREAAQIAYDILQKQMPNYLVVLTKLG